jgi:hypothetical protein
MDYRRYYLIREWPNWAQAVVIIIITVLITIGLILFLPDAVGNDQSESSGFKMAAEESRPYVFAQAPTEPPPSQYDTQILVLEREAIDEAFREHLKHLYLVWMKDESAQPARAMTGARQARSAYIRIMQAFERRQQQAPK